MLAHNSRRLRAARGWSQEKLALEAGVARSFVNDLERQDRNLTIDMLQKIIRAFGVRAVDLFHAG
ncbi:MAG: transcriptional regulator [Ancylobacter novellus]|uniref:Transcriptional regulator n=1 Tax=Ancylobacter novellus TaxID=921 RepID=A0A2W5MGF5_ANCNO|nr:MAG: transcriptional regulator [Ancylobacter novellus]